MNPLNSYRVHCSLLLIAIMISGCASTSRQATGLIGHLEAGDERTIVTYGTSLTAEPWSTWVSDVQTDLDRVYPGQVTIINGAKGGMWSTWGVENLVPRVLRKRPNLVLIEFGINDAYLEYETSVEQARINLIDMINGIQQWNPRCEIILMTMNPPIEVHLERRPDYEEYYEMYRDVAKERDLLLIDHQRRWEKILRRKPELFDRYVPDGIHPGPEGCSEVITPAILKALGVRAQSTRATD
ncbi:MAG: SGNH/GDSL hydrolase family protein [Candidatus Hydrogenedentota bacterium]